MVHGRSASSASFVWHRATIAALISCVMALGGLPGTLGTATSQTSGFTCPDGTSTGPIGPHDSTPPGYGGAAPLSAGAEWLWTGPCGTSARDPASKESDYDHFYVDLDEAADLSFGIEWADPSDGFFFTIYRGRVDITDRGFKRNCADAAPGEPCVLATPPGVPETDGGHQVEETRVPALSRGIYTMRVRYSAVVEGAYEGTISATSASATAAPTPSDELREGLGPVERGSYPEATSDTFFHDQWGLAKIQAPQAWQNHRATGFGITIGVVDSGLELGHPDFSCAGKVLLPAAAAARPQDANGHGTHVAGIAAACSNNEEGVAGVAPDAAIMPVKVQGAIEPSAFDQNMARGIRAATEARAHVINLSIGQPPPWSYSSQFYPQTEKALAHAHEAGVVIAAAAGNFSSPVCEYPSLSRFVICVGATDSNDERTFYSDLPVNVDVGTGDVHASVVAPGGRPDAVSGRPETSCGTASCRRT